MPALPSLRNFLLLWDRIYLVAWFAVQRQHLTYGSVRAGSLVLVYEFLRLSLPLVFMVVVSLYFGSAPIRRFFAYCCRLPSGRPWFNNGFFYRLRDFAVKLDVPVAVRADVLHRAGL
jgi:hypothetical protein